MCVFHPAKPLRVPLLRVARLQLHQGFLPHACCSVSWPGQWLTRLSISTDAQLVKGGRVSCSASLGT
jgi:hypothetical protein